MRILEAESSAVLQTYEDTRPIDLKGTTTRKLYQVYKTVRI